MGREKPGELNFTAGQVIDRSVFEPLYGEHLDPRDPAGKTKLGRAAQRFSPEEAIFKDLAAAEPHASPARLAELRTLAKTQARHAVPFWDVTMSVSKSITLFYGGLLAAAEQARRSGDAVRADQMERRAGRVWAAIMEGNRAALEYLQDEAGMTRTGYHRGSDTESGAELGKWEHARNWVIGTAVRALVRSSPGQRLRKIATSVRAGDSYLQVRYDVGM